MSHLQLSQKIQLVTKDFQKSIDLLKTCIDAALGKNGLVQLLQSREEQKKKDENMNLVFSNADKIEQE